MAKEDEKNELRVEDRRHFDKDGNPIRQDEAEEGQSSGQDNSRPEQPRPAGGPIPKIDFAALVFIYVQTALVHLGELEDPVQHKAVENLEAARQMIDIVELLQEKTKGNLTAQEAQYLQGALFDLRMRYVQKAKKT